jgi:hypothetical protein
MTHKKNRDLKAELVEMQLAAQHWEEKHNEVRAELGQASAELRAQAAEVARLRALLGLGLLPEAEAAQ